jgi:hypothetical protein
MGNGAHQFAPFSGGEHHREAAPRGVRTFLNAAIRLWYFEVESTLEE